MSAGLFRVIGVVCLFAPFVFGTQHAYVDQATLAVPMAFVCWAWAEALRKDARIDRLEIYLRAMHMRGSNLKQGASIEDFRDVFR